MKRGQWGLVSFPSRLRGTDCHPSVKPGGFPFFFPRKGRFFFLITEVENKRRSTVFPFFSVQVHVAPLVGADRAPSNFFSPPKKKGVDGLSPFALSFHVELK